VNAARQVLAITGMNLRAIPDRLGSSLVVCVGIAGVVAVLVTVLAMATGLSKTLLVAGKPDRAIVLRSGAFAESFSSVSVEATLAVEAAPGIVRRDGALAVSPEALVSANLPRASDGALIAALIRGLTPTAAEVRPEITLLDGRMFRAGLREVVVGREAKEQYRDLDLGDRAAFYSGEWTVVGVFSSNGDAHESELLADAATLMSAAQRTVFNAITVKLESPEAFDAFERAVENDPLLKVDARRETEYYKAQSEDIGALLDVIARVVGGIMALGALFGALNTMYSAVSIRSVEIATLRAIGFGATPVVVSVLVEALLLSLVGAAAGAAIAWLLFDGNAFSTGGSLGQVSLHLDIGPALVITGAIWASVIGLIGGALPAIRAARLSVADGLRVV